MIGFKGLSFTGNLGGDAEFSGNFAKIRVAVRQPTPKGQEEQTIWVSLDVAGSDSEYFRERAKKGARIVVMGASLGVKVKDGRYFFDARCHVGDLDFPTTGPKGERDKTDLPF